MPTVPVLVVFVAMLDVEVVVVEVLAVSEMDEAVLVGPVVDSRLMVDARACTR
jgi:hypothetical protein